MHNSEDSRKNMNDLGGQWSGKINTGGREAKVQVNFSDLRINDASINLADHDRRFIPLINADYKPPKVHFEYFDKEDRAVFDGTLNNNKMAGSFSQNGESGSFELTKKPDERKDENQHYNSDLNYP